MPTLYSCSYYSRVRIGTGDGILASLITITSGANEANVPAYGLFLIKKEHFLISAKVRYLIWQYAMDYNNSWYSVVWGSSENKKA